MHLIENHPALCVFVGFWLFSAFADGMPQPTDRSGVAYIWLHNSLQLATGTLSKAIAVRYPTVAASRAVDKIEASAGHAAGTLFLFVAQNFSFFAAKAQALQQYFAARFPLGNAYGGRPLTLYQPAPPPAPRPGESMSTAAVVSAPSTAKKIPFLTRLKSFIAGAFRKEPKVETIIKSTLLYTAPLVETVETLVTGNPALAVETENIFSQIKVGFAAVDATVNEAGSAPTAVSILSSVNSNIKALESAVQVKDPALATKVQATTNLITGEIEAMLQELSPEAAKNA